MHSRTPGICPSPLSRPGQDRRVSVPVGAGSPSAPVPPAAALSLGYLPGHSCQYSQLSVPIPVCPLSCLSPQLSVCPHSCLSVPTPVCPLSCLSSQLSVPSAICLSPLLQAFTLLAGLWTEAQPLPAFSGSWESPIFPAMETSCVPQHPAGPSFLLRAWEGPLNLSS